MVDVLTTEFFVMNHNMKFNGVSDFMEARTSFAAGEDR